MLVVVLFAAVVYTIAWTLERRRTLGKGNALPKRRSKPQMKQVAPDDDEDFLRWLDRKRRKDGTDGQGQEPAAD